jgi:hypothetical protein
LIGIIIPIIIAILILVPRGQAYFKASSILQNGVETNATVLKSRHWIENYSNVSRHEYVHDTLIYEFKVNGIKLTNEVDYIKRNFTPIVKGDTILIVYSSKEPEINNLKENYQHDLLIEQTVFDTFIIMILVYMFILFFIFLLKRKLIIQLEV